MLSTLDISCKYNLPLHSLHKRGESCSLHYHHINGNSIRRITFLSLSLLSLRWTKSLNAFSVFISRVSGWINYLFSRSTMDDDILKDDISSKIFSRFCDVANKKEKLSWGSIWVVYWISKWNLVFLELHVDTIFHVCCFCVRWN